MPSEVRGVPVTDDALRAAAEAVGRSAGLTLVLLFGSAARDGPARARDLDLGVLARGPADVVALTNAFTRALGVQAVDVTDLRRADALLLALAARDGVALFEGEPSAHARFASLAVRRFFDTQKFRDAERDYIRAFIAEFTPNEGRGAP